MGRLPEHSSGMTSSGSGACPAKCLCNCSLHRHLDFTVDAVLAEPSQKKLTNCRLEPNTSDEGEYAAHEGKQQAKWEAPARHRATAGSI